MHQFQEVYFIPMRHHVAELQDMLAELNWLAIP